MLLEGKKIIIMGVRNKWSIAWGAAQSAYENGAEIIFTYGTMENKEKKKRQSRRKHSMQQRAMNLKKKAAAAKLRYFLFPF